MEEKAAEGNLTYFSEFSTEELEGKLRHLDEDDRTLLHIAAAAGAFARISRPNHQCRFSQRSLFNPSRLGFRLQGFRV